VDAGQQEAGEQPTSPSSLCHNMPAVEQYPKMHFPDSSVVAQLHIVSNAKLHLEMFVFSVAVSRVWNDNPPLF